MVCRGYHCITDTLLVALFSRKPGGSSPGIYQVLSTGELYIVSIVVLIAGITEIVLLLRRIMQDLTVALLILAGIIFVVLAAARYTGVSELAATASHPHSIAFWSVGAFLISAIHSSICVGLAAGAR
jgi:hypothetical protein